MEIAALLLVVAVIVLLVTKLVQARAFRCRAFGTDHGGAHPPALDDDPPSAASRPRRYDLALAVRLRFRAGLLRLDRDAHAITYRHSIPTGEVRAELASPTFDELADTFEGITYGGNDAGPDDTAEARHDWPGVVHAARRR